MTDTIRVGGVPEHFNLPWKLAIEEHAFEEHGLDVRFTDYPAGTGAMVAALRDGELDVAVVLTEGAVLDALSGSGNRLVRVFVDSPLTWGIHVAAGGPVHDVADIAGHPVAISRYGSGSHLIAIVDAIERGFDPGSMEFVVVDNLDGARRALAAGDADVFLWEKHMTQPLVDSGEFRRVGERVVPWPAFVVSVRPGILDTRPDDLRTMLDTVRDRAKQLQTDPHTVTLVAERYGLAERDAAAWFRTVLWSDNKSCPEDAIRRVARALHAQGAIAAADVDPHAIWHTL